MFSFITTRHNFFPAHKAALHPWHPGKQLRCPSQGYRVSTAKESPAAFGIRRPGHDLFSCFKGKKARTVADACVGGSLGTRRRSVPAICNLDAPHRRSCSHGCGRYRHGSAYGTKSSDLRTCQVLPCYLVLHGAIRLAFHSGIHPHLPQRRGDAYPLPSPVGAVADGCGMPATSSALALGAAHARGSAASQ